MDNENFNIIEEGRENETPATNEAQPSPIELPLTTPKKIIASNDISNAIGGFLKNSTKPISTFRHGKTILWVDRIKSVIKRYINLPYKEEEEYKKISTEYQEEGQNKK